MLLIASTFRDAIKFNIHGYYVDDASRLILFVALARPLHSTCSIRMARNAGDVCAHTHTFGRACVAHFKMMTLVILLAIKLPYIGFDGSMVHSKRHARNCKQCRQNTVDEKEGKKQRKFPISRDCKCAICAICFRHNKLLLW